jgi:glycerol uptake facilitator-like aquaporin
MLHNRGFEVTNLATLRSDRVGPASVPSIGLARRAVADGLATAFLLAIVVGSGMMGERLAAGNLALTLLANSIASGAGLIALILAFGPISGAHLNPIVTLSEAWRGSFPWPDVPAYLAAQTAGAIAGVAAAQLMFGDPVFSVSHHSRAGLAQVFAELVATFGLVVVLRGASRMGNPASAISVGLYILAAYWFTSSTSFANPAVTLARALTDSFTGIRPLDVPGFLLGQAAGGSGAILFLRWVDAPERGEPTNTR